METGFAASPTATVNGFVTSQNPTKTGFTMSHNPHVTCFPTSRNRADVTDFFCHVSDSTLISLSEKCC